MDDENVLRREDCIFLKGVFGNRMGELALTNKRFLFMKQKVYGLGAVATLAQVLANESGLLDKCIMNVMLDDIASYERGKSGRNKNVLLITDKAGAKYKISLGAKWEEWEPLFKEYISI